MSPAYDKTKCGKYFLEIGNWKLGFLANRRKPVGKRVSFQMVDSDYRLFPKKTKGFRKIDSDPKRRLKAGAVSNGDNINLWRL